MDELGSAAGSPAPSPAKGRGGPGRRGAAGRAAAAAARKTARKNGVARRGGRGGRGRGRNKTYDQPRVQAHYERSKELRDIYSDVANAMKPALERLADNSLAQMIDNPLAYQQVPEYQAVRQELDDRFSKALDQVETERTARHDMISKEHNLSMVATRGRFLDGFEYVTDEFLDGILNRMTLLEELRREDCGTTVPAQYTYKQIPTGFVKNQGPYVVYRNNGSEVPYPGLLEEFKSSSMRTTLARKAKPGPKRKADDLPDGQPEFKKHALSSAHTSFGLTRSAMGRDDADVKLEVAGDASTPRPRHIGGLLSAENEPDGEPESNAPSPSPLEEGLTPERELKADMSSKKDLPDLPAGASEADQWGVRTVFKRGPKANNRIMIPAVFEFDKDEIGFRDSTNDGTRKATRTARGRFLNTPNSQYWHLDQTIAFYNALDHNDGDLDPDLVKKHNLHPKYGFFLPTSTNEAEPPGEHVTGLQPVVVITPDGATLHASRTVRARVMDDALKSDLKKNKVAKMLRQYMTDEGVTDDEITTLQMRERERIIVERQTVEPEDADDTLLDELDDDISLYSSDPNMEWIRHNNTAQLLDASAHISQRERLQLSNAPQRSNRSYDAVRDIFGNSGPIAPPPVRTMEAPELTCLAHVAENPEAYRNLPKIIQRYDYAFMDPRLNDGLRRTPSRASNAFLQTALNPTPAFAHIAPAPVPIAPLAPAPISAPVFSSYMEGQPAAPAARNPFTAQGSTKGSPVLPPLRPAKRDKLSSSASALDGGQQHIAPAPLAPAPLAPAPPQHPQLASLPSQDFDSPRDLMPSSAGSFYHAPGHRQFHNYGIPELASQGPLMPLPQQQAPVPGGTIMLHSLPPQAPQQLASLHAMSPPMSGPAQLAPMPRMGLSPPLVSQGAPGPPGSAIMSPSPVGTPAPRSRGSASSNGQNNGKYRKIAAAPVPYNRMWTSSGGSELRLSNYDPKGAIKDYTANEPPPRTGPTTIRGWSVLNGQKRGKPGTRKEGSVEEIESPK